MYRGSPVKLGHGEPPLQRPVRANGDGANARGPESAVATKVIDKLGLFALHIHADGYRVGVRGAVQRVAP